MAAGKLGLRTEQPLALGTASENVSLSYDVLSLSSDLFLSLSSGVLYLSSDLFIQI